MIEILSGLIAFSMSICGLCVCYWLTGEYPEMYLFCVLLTFSSLTAAIGIVEAICGLHDRLSEFFSRKGGRR